MTYQVTARKWRPQSFEEIIGQQVVTRTLQNAIRSERIAHAFLFSGVRGVGKTSTARILAKALNCTQGPTPQPCGQCDPCREIAAGNSIDVLEIDAASNTGVDHIRELREMVRYGTARDRFKVFIIDEVHMLSNAAFNALLKTLEEPPAHVKFILATTERHKIPVTITSRCQQYEFRPIPFSQILERLRGITEHEGIQAGEYALRTIAASAQGSMRDAESALDRIVAFCGNQIDDDDARALLGAVDGKLISDLLDSVSEKDSPALIRQIQEINRSGIPAQNFCRRMIEYIRTIMVCRVAGWDESLLQTPDSEREDLERHAERFSELDLIRFYDQLTRTEGELKWHALPFVHLEMTLLKLVELARLPRLEQVIEQLQSGQGAPGLSPLPEPPASPPPPKISKPSGKNPAQPEIAVESRPEPTDAAPPNPPEAQKDADIEEADPVELLLNHLHEEMVPLKEQLRWARIVWNEAAKISLTFPHEFSWQAKALQDPERLEKLARACAHISGVRPSIEISVEEPDQTSEAREDPLKNPKVQKFVQEWNGKVSVEWEDQSS